MYIIIYIYVNVVAGKPQVAGKSHPLVNVAGKPQVAGKSHPLVNVAGKPQVAGKSHPQKAGKPMVAGKPPPARGWLGSHPLPRWCFASLGGLSGDPDSRFQVLVLLDLSWVMI